MQRVLLVAAMLAGLLATTGAAREEIWIGICDKISLFAGDAVAARYDGVPASLLLQDIQDGGYPPALASLLRTIVLDAFKLPSSHGFSAQADQQLEFMNRYTVYCWSVLHEDGKLD